MCQHVGREVDEDVIPGIAFGFAGGMGNSGTVCGALAGAVMAVSLLGGRPEEMDEAMAMLARSGELVRRFEAEMGATACSALTGADLTTEEGIAAYMASDTPAKVCFPAVARAYALTVELLEEEGAGG